jgi:hypothetical protein
MIRLQGNNLIKHHNFKIGHTKIWGPTCYPKGNAIVKLIVMTCINIVNTNISPDQHDGTGGHSWSIFMLTTNPNDMMLLCRGGSFQPLDPCVEFTMSLVTGCN